MRRGEESFFVTVGPAAYCRILFLVRHRPVSLSCRFAGNI